MKNSTSSVLLIAFGLLPFAAAAQPTLTASGINPVIGDVLTTHTTQYVSPGSAGANQTWNLSAMTSSGSSASTGVAPSSTPYSSSFPTASVAFGPTSYVYYKTSSSAFQMNGIVNGAGTVIAYSDLEDMLRFPTAYNNSYTDSWSATFVQASYTYYRTGSTTVTADGWGTLTTPAGTFTNVMRVHFVQTYQDSTYIANMPFVINYQNDEYMWYLNGNHSPVAAVYDLTTTSGSFTGGFYLQNVVSGTEEQEIESSLSLFPNPATDNISLTYTVSAAQDVAVSIYDATGKLVRNEPQTQSAEGENVIRIYIGDLPEGVYFATITTEANIPVTRRFVVSQ